MKELVIKITGRINGWRDNQGNPKKLKILILNWRDTKHDAAGGAEVYIHELAKRWVKQGHEVTLFCGNDGKNLPEEMIAGYRVIRKGGFLTVYFWAFIYYIRQFRNKYDILLDCSNGVPFFSPLYSALPKIHLIHHVHNTVFKHFLKYPWSQFAIFIESKLVPLLYKNIPVVTVSGSSRADIIRVLKIKKDKVTVITPGVNQSVKVFSKTVHPSLIYLGRLKRYKNIDLGIKAFAKVLKSIPQATLDIAGEGEAKADLEKLVKDLGIEKSVNFLGRVSEGRKKYYLERSWIAIQPSFLEGWGITVLEANAHMTPVVAFNVPGLKDSIVNGVTGILINKRSIESYSASLLNLLSSPSVLQEMSLASHLWAKSFNWNERADLFYQVLRYRLYPMEEEKAQVAVAKASG